MRYDLEADWILLNTCNYRCSYCFFSAPVLGSKLRTFATPQEWRSAFDATGNVWLLHITGGEPSIYPEFVELCRGLTERHYISINSNLTGSSLAEFAQHIDRRRVSFINAGLHLEERETRFGHAKFLRHADIFRSKGFPILVSLVATPTALARFEEAIALLEPVGLFPIPKLLRGPFEGQLYPNAYSQLDKKRFRLFSEEARKFYEPLLAGMAHLPSIYMFNDDEYLDAEPSYSGVPCDAGYRFVSIRPNGDVLRCGPVWNLGNILGGTFVRRSGPAPCNSKHCFYFCQKYTQIENVAPPVDPTRVLADTP